MGLKRFLSEFSAKHWDGVSEATKQIPLFFSGQFTNIDKLLNGLVAFVAFSLSASAMYIFNDYKDLKEDRKHPKKKYRPLASGLISKNAALSLMTILLIMGFSCSNSPIEAECRWMMILLLFFRENLMLFHQLMDLIKHRRP